MLLIESTLIDNCISRVRNGQEFVHLLNSLSYSNQDIELSIEHYLDTPTLTGEWEQIILDQSIKYLQKLNDH